MAVGIGPIRGDLVRVEIPEITRLDTSTEPAVPRPIIVLMKRGVAEFFELDEMDTNDERFQGTFPNVDGNTNANASYRRRLGGRGTASYTFLSAGTLDITEYFFDENNAQQTATRTVKSFTQGFPRGHSVNEILSFIEGRPQAVIDKIRAIIAPSKAKTNVNFSSSGT